MSFIPVTPAGTACMWLAAGTEEKAWANLLREAAHMPYRGIAGFKKRGYTIAELAASDQPKSGNRCGTK